MKTNQPFIFKQRYSVAPDLRNTRKHHSLVGFQIKLIHLFDPNLLQPAKGQQEELDRHLAVAGPEVGLINPSPGQTKL